MSNNGEASGSDDGMSDDDMALDEIAQAVIDHEMREDPEGVGLTAAEIAPTAAQQREQDIIAEVARRRAERDEANAVKRKSDEIFDRFDADKDSYLSYNELRELGRATGGELPKAAYTSICEEIGADPSKGVSKALLLIMYTDAGLGDAHRDYNLIFNKK